MLPTSRLCAWQAGTPRYIQACTIGTCVAREQLEGSTKGLESAHVVHVVGVNDNRDGIDDPVPVARRWGSRPRLLRHVDQQGRDRLERPFNDGLLPCPAAFFELLLERAEEVLPQRILDLLGLVAHHDEGRELLYQRAQEAHPRRLHTGRDLGIEEVVVVAQEDVLRAQILEALVCHVFGHIIQGLDTLGGHPECRLLNVRALLVLPPAACRARVRA